MPSLTSHGVGEYYAHASNAFWWIAGAALGFRRGGPGQDRTWPDQFQTKPSKSILAVISGEEVGPVLTYPGSEGQAVVECRARDGGGHYGQPCTYQIIITGEANF